MISTHVKVIVRQFERNKIFSFVNLFGLTTGITVCLLVAQFILFESSFEDFNKKADRTYRINLYNTTNGTFTGITPSTVSGLGYAMQQTIPGIESMARFSSKITGIVSNESQKLRDQEDNIVNADPSIIDALAIELIEGDKSEILKDQQSIIIAESIAKKYFGDIHAFGKILEIGFNNGDTIKKTYQIEGVFRDIPANANEHFDFILPIANSQAWNENWSWSNVHTFIVLSSNVNPETLNSGLSKIVEQYHKDGKGDRYMLEPITGIRLHALDGTGRATLVNFFILLGVVILLLAWFNYINLSTAGFFERMKEVGVRKLIGASRGQLILQLMFESFIFNIISFFCALLLFYFSWPVVTDLFHLSIPISLIHEPLSFLVILVSVIIGTVCSGFYPAIFLSSFKPLQSIKGKVANFATQSSLRKTLVVVQLAVSVVLITGMLVIQQQVDYMQSQNLGIAIEQIMVVDAPLLTNAKSVQKFEPFKNEILQLPGVKNLTYASSFPGAEIDWNRSDITLERANADYKYSSRILAIGTEFIDVFGLQMVTGRNFDPQIENDKKTMLINEEACKMFGFNNYNDALNKMIFVGSRKFEIIGVMKNYHFRSFQYQMQPLLFMQGYPRSPGYAIKISPERISETIAAIKSRWEKRYSGNVFNYSFLDESFEKQYTNEQQLGKIVGALTILAVLISCSGLFGLSLYAVNRRTKEIGIRKVLGATAMNIVGLLTGDYLKLVAAGGVVAIPIIYNLVRYWLKGYAYQMPLDSWLFIFPVVLVTLFAVVTIGFQTMSAAQRNPVDTIKYE
jgi:putative ABC transport system permease protein